MNLKSNNHRFIMSALQSFAEKVRTAHDSFSQVMYASSKYKKKCNWSQQIDVVKRKDTAVSGNWIICDTMGKSAGSWLIVIYI